VILNYFILSQGGVIVQEGIDIMGNLEPDTIEVILDQHEKELEKQDTRISKLEETTTKILVTQAEMSVKLSNIEVGQIKIEKSINENMNEQKHLINKMIDISTEGNKEDKNIIKNTQIKLWELIFKGLAILGVLLGAGNILKDAVK
jgi:hypothetical protein